MAENSVFTFVNQTNGNLAFKFFRFEDNRHFDHLQRNNFYSLIWVKTGKGLLRVDFSEYSFSKNTLFAFAPYQPFMFSTDEKMEGIVLQFHPDFYCIHRNPQETNCDMTLFNNIYEAPFFQLDERMQTGFQQALEQLEMELKNESPGNQELLVPYLKILLVTATRFKIKALKSKLLPLDSKTPAVLVKLKTEIEKNFRKKHSTSDYAELLHITPNALAKLVKTHFQKTPTELITERLIIEAKRELYMTTKPVKEIAWQLGYADEFYFSRVFKNHADLSPQAYRERVGFGKAEG